MKYLLDTSVASQATKARPDAAASQWLQGMAMEALGLSVITIEEVRLGIELLPHGRKRQAIEEWLLKDIVAQFGDRIIPVSSAVADTCGRIISASKMATGHVPELADALIAATAIVHGLKVATLNRKHFERLGVDLVDL